MTRSVAKIFAVLGGHMELLECGHLGAFFAMDRERMVTRASHPRRCHDCEFKTRNAAKRMAARSPFK